MRISIQIIFLQTKKVENFTFSTLIIKHNILKNDDFFMLVVFFGDFIHSIKLIFKLFLLIFPFFCKDITLLK